MELLRRDRELDGTGDRGDAPLGQPGHVDFRTATRDHELGGQPIDAR